MKALSLFSGIGGIDRAAQLAGIETVAFCERDPFCQKVLKKHWPNTPIYDDVCTLTKERLEADGIGAIDVVFSGDPCQPYSLSGDREGEGDDRFLWPEVNRLLKTLIPRWVIRENVAGNITLGLDGVLADLENLSYSWQAIVLPAAAVGAPHRRNRVFVVGNAECVRFEGESWRGSNQFIKDGYFQLEENSKGTGWTNQSRVGGVFDGLPTELDGYRWPAGRGQPQYDWEPPRIKSGVKNRTDRIKALGNSVVPAQIYPILAAIKQIDDTLKEVM